MWITSAPVARFPQPIVAPAWLAEHYDEVLVADVRWYLDGRSGRAAFEAGHLPGAVFVDLDADLSAAGPDRPTDGRHPLPTPASFAAAMSDLGIGDGTAVVAYDDSGGGTAGRLVWMLRVTGHDAALLDGGLGGSSGPVETGPSRSRPAAPFTPTPWPRSALMDADEVADAATSGSAVVLDARSAERYRGEAEPVDARSGHIPGARSAPWAANLDAHRHFLPPTELRARFATLGAVPGTEVIAYCGSGVSACANLLALEQAGIGGAKLFVASWSGWAADPRRPAATG